MRDVSRWTWLLIVGLGACAEAHQGREPTSAATATPPDEQPAHAAAPAAVPDTPGTTASPPDEQASDQPASDLTAEAAEPEVTSPEAPARIPDGAGVSVPVRALGGRCGNNTRSTPTRETHVRATTRGRGRIRLAITDYSYYCSPAPRFEARRAEATVVLSLLPMESGTPVARCICYHSVTAELGELPPGDHRVVVELNRKRPVNRDGRWVEEPITVETVVTAR